MPHLVIGSTGHVGSALIEELSDRGRHVIAMSRHGGHSGSDGVEHVRGDVDDISTMRHLLRRVDTVFILNPVVPDELTRAILVLDLCAEANLRGIVYLSMINADRFDDVPHAASKAAAERAIARLDLPATILRPNYFFQNDAAHRREILENGVYPIPIGSAGVTMVDVGDIAAIAAVELIRREEASSPQAAETIEVVGPDCFTGSDMAALWSEVLGQPVGYGGDDVGKFEETLARAVPSHVAYDTALMFRAFHRDGMRGAPDAAAGLEARLGRPLRRYRDFAEDTAAEWRRPLVSRLVDAVMPAGDR
ncbi:NmrA family NAD(P)-binding protein [Roseomonas mucosa]|nr:NmrA family NAD(P)-binding protein [Roseomonas mucosa]